MRDVTVPRGSRANLIEVFNSSLLWERNQGLNYYAQQKHTLLVWARISQLPIERVAAAFAALSPNNSEKTNYKALDTCLKIVAGQLPETWPVISYRANKIKALKILRGENIEKTLTGCKVYAFYRNTMDPADEEFITVDGHMLGAWVGQRLILRREAAIKSSKEYAVICEDFRAAAKETGLPATGFQATLWLTWKRLNRILYTSQLSFQWEGKP